MHHDHGYTTDGPVKRALDHDMYAVNGRIATGACSKGSCQANKQQQCLNSVADTEEPTTGHLGIQVVRSSRTTYFLLSDA